MLTQMIPNINALEYTQNVQINRLKELKRNRDEMAEKLIRTKRKRNKLDSEFLTCLQTCKTLEPKIWNLIDIEEGYEQIFNTIATDYSNELTISLNIQKQINDNLLQKGELPKTFPSELILKDPLIINKTPTYQKKENYIPKEKKIVKLPENVNPSTHYTPIIPENTIEDISELLSYFK